MLMISYYKKHISEQFKTIVSQKEDKMISCGNCPYLDDCDDNDECPFWDDEDDE